MANIGDQLPSPLIGYKRIEDNDSNISVNGTWGIENGSHNSGGSAMYSSGINNSISFRFLGTKFIVIGGMYPGRTTKCDVLIDGIKHGTINEDGTSKSKTVVFSIKGLENKIHSVSLVLQERKVCLIDAIDIDSDGILVPVLSRDYEFPIAVIEESEVDGYAKSLINGEEQLLITPTGKLFLTNGDKGFVTVGGEVDLSSYYTKEEIDKLIADNLHKHTNKAQLNKIGESANMLTFNGKIVVNNNEYAFRSLPRAKVVKDYSIRKGGRLPWLI